MFDRVWVMWIGCFKEFLKVVFGHLSLSLEVTFGIGYELLTGVVSSLIVVAVAGHYGNVTGSALLPLFVALNAFDGGFRGCGLTTIGGRCCIT
jgi:hypothetical protein